jgi:hypothetical protein
MMQAHSRTKIMTNRLAAALPLMLAALSLAGCGSEPDPAANSADSFAQRINQNAAATPAPLATATPQIAQPLPGAAPGAFAEGTLTDPASQTCGANLMGPFIGKPADQPTRAAIAQTLGRTENLRFVPYGTGGFVNPDPTNPRLSLMLDAQNIIRDARCG